MSASQLRWAVSGWAFFIAENAILSEHRTYLIDYLGGDDTYHAVYGTISTLATGSIAYGYYKLKTSRGTLPSRPLLAWVGLSLGFSMASQALPKLQIPVGLSEGSSLQVRCPFDFTSSPEGSLHGVERISRHSGLWSFGFTGLGLAALQTSLPMRLWWTGPASVALLGGWHQDSRFRRGLGGKLDPYLDSQTSNVPFAALLTGRQGNVAEALVKLASELKPLNCALAMGLAAVLTRRGIRLL